MISFFNSRLLISIILAYYCVNGEFMVDNEIILKLADRLQNLFITKVTFRSE
jgi:hypothetical protein